MTPTFFETPTALRRWFKAYHLTAAELWIGFYKRASGRGGVVYRQALDEALCFGWIDGVLRRVDDVSYAQRFTPRRPRSNWSAVNIARANELIAEGRMQPAGLAAFERRVPDRSAADPHQPSRAAAFTPAERRALKTKPEAWRFLEARPPSYRRAVAGWIHSAKKPETRARRLEALVDCCARGQLAPPFIQRPQK